MIDTQIVLVLIEDNEVLRENTKAYLTLKNIMVYDYESVEDFQSQGKQIQDIDVLLVDINLPGKSWIEFLQDLKQIWDQTPFILVTSMNTTSDIVQGLEFGADDYVSKPFNFEELVARIKMVITRKWMNNIADKIELHLNDDIVIEVNREFKKVKRNGENIYLPTLEYNLLNYFLENRGKIIPRDELYQEVWWEFDKYQLSRTVDVYIWYLRKKLSKDIIITKKWDGYYLK